MNSFRRLLVCVSLLLFAFSATAATRTWAGKTGSWSDPAMWVGGVVPQAGDDLVFPPGDPDYIAYGAAPDDTIFRSLTIPAGTPRSIQVDEILIGEGGIVDLAEGTTLGWSSSVVLVADQTWETGPGVHLEASGLMLNGHTLTVNNRGSVGFAFRITGSGHVIINGGTAGIGPSSGPSTLTLNGVEAYLVPEPGCLTCQPDHPGEIIVNSGPASDSSTGLYIDCRTGGPVTVNGDTLRTHYARCFSAHTGDLTMGPGGAYGGDQIFVQGTLTLGGAALRLTLDPVLPPEPWHSWIPIANDGTDPIAGTFAGLPEGSVYHPGGDLYFVITYRGGDGNDVEIIPIPPPAHSFTVTNLNDSGAGSLRQAIAGANAAAGYDYIGFDAALAGTITLTTGEMAIDDDVTILGTVTKAIAISGNDASRIFSIDAAKVRLTNLTLTAGKAGEGGAIHAAATQLDLLNLTLTGNTATTGSGGALHATASTTNPSLLRIANCAFTSNAAPHGSGGGVFADLNEVEVTNTMMTGNEAGARGGGIHTPNGALTVWSSTFDGNRSCLETSAMSCGGGGASAGAAAAGIARSTFSGNSAANGGNGGAISAAGSLTLDFSTLTENSAAEGGGLHSPSASSSVSSSTLVNNTATGRGGGAFLGGGKTVSNTITGNSAGGDGGGLYFDAVPLGTGAQVAGIYNSILADNVSTAGTPEAAVKAGGDAIRVAYSLLRTPGSANLQLLDGVITGADPKLGPLQVDPGSPTATRVPVAGSPVIDTGETDMSPNEYQLEIYRDQRYFERIAGGRIDMGSVEVQAAPTRPDLRLSVPNATFVATRAGSYTIAVNNVGPAAAANVIVMDMPPAGATVLSADPSRGTCSVGTKITCNLGELVPGAGATIEVRMRFDAPAITWSMALVSYGSGEPGWSNNRVIHVYTVQPMTEVPQHDLRVTGSVEVLATAVHGSEARASAAERRFLYTFVVTNLGPDPAGDVVLTDNIPAEATLVSATTTKGSCSFASPKVICSLGTLGNGGTATIAITLSTTSSGSITNTATVTDDDCGGLGETKASDNVATITIESHIPEHVIPTLSQWMLLLLLASLGLAAAMRAKGGG